MILISIAALLSSMQLGSLGSIVLWRRMSNFGDSLAHGIILSSALVHFFKIPLFFASVIISFIFVAVNNLLQFKTNDRNLILNIISSFFVAISVILGNLFNYQIDLGALIFGNIITVSTDEIAILFVASIVTILFILIYYHKIILSTFSPEIAQINGINTYKINLYFSLLLGLNIAISVKIVGVLLMSSMIIIPASIGRLLSTRPHYMIINSIIVSIISSIIGIYLSFRYDITISSSIVVILTTIYFVLHFIKNLKKI